MIIEVKRVTFYGDTGFKPTNEAGKKMVNLMKKKTFNKNEVVILTSLGFTFKLAEESIL